LIYIRILKKTKGTEVEVCPLCQDEILIYGFKCPRPNCSARLHPWCLLAYLEGSKARNSRVLCINECQQVWPLNFTQHLVYLSNPDHCKQYIDHYHQLHKDDDENENDENDNEQQEHHDSDVMNDDMNEND